MANETNFQPGDVVQLKSGGTLMTIKVLYDNYGVPSASVCYSSANSPVATLEGVALVTLKKVDPPQEIPKLASQPDAPASDK